MTLTFEWKVNPYANVREEIVKIIGSVDGLSAEADFTVTQGGAPDIESVKNTPAGDSLALLSISRFLGCWSEYDTGVKMERWEGGVQGSQNEQFSRQRAIEDMVAVDLVAVR